MRTLKWKKCKKRFKKESCLPAATPTRFPVAYLACCTALLLQKHAPTSLSLPFNGFPHLPQFLGFPGAPLPLPFPPTPSSGCCCCRTCKRPAATCTRAAGLKIREPEFVEKVEKKLTRVRREFVHSYY